MRTQGNSKTKAKKVSVAHNNQSHEESATSSQLVDKRTETQQLKAFGEAIASHPRNIQFRKLKSGAQKILDNTPFQLAPVIQRTLWEWDGEKWIKAENQYNEVESDAPSDPGHYKGEQLDTSFSSEEDDDEKKENGSNEEEEENPYSGEQEIGENGATIDYDALNSVMDDVTIGEQVRPNVWRKMRQDLSEAVTLANKSHPAHGSNFNRNQRPEQQIKDWASVISGDIKEALIKYFKDKHEIDLE